MSEIFVVAEPSDRGEHPVNLEVYRVAQDIAGKNGWGWTKLDMRLPYNFGSLVAHADAVARSVQSANMVLMAATATGKDLMARVAGHLEAPLVQDCTAYHVERGEVIFTRSLYGGKVLADVRVKATPTLATLRPRTQPAMTQVENMLTQVVNLPAIEPVVSVERRVAEGNRLLDVAEADIVVSGGRGMQGPEHWHILEALVDALGPRATLACSRPVSDAGWRPRAEHVGQTGRSIAPDVYVACGISGAVQHTAGIAASKCIIVINRDAEAPIFEVADYGIVGDLFDVVPALTEAIRDFRSKGG